MFEYIILLGFRNIYFAYLVWYCFVSTKLAIIRLLSVGTTFFNTMSSCAFVIFLCWIHSMDSIKWHLKIKNGVHWIGLCEKLGHQFLVLLNIYVCRHVFYYRLSVEFVVTSILFLNSNIVVVFVYVFYQWVSSYLKWNSRVEIEIYLLSGSHSCKTGIRVQIKVSFEVWNFSCCNFISTFFGASYSKEFPLQEVFSACSFSSQYHWRFLFGVLLRYNWFANNEFYFSFFLFCTHFYF